MPDIRPDRTNWQQFCQEPPLTKKEAALWDQMAKAVGEDDELFDFIFGATEAEGKELRRAELASRSDDWSDLVAFADAARKLKRAEIKAWAKWKEAEIEAAAKRKERVKWRQSS